jgi:hypothetical protein
MKERGLKYIKLFAEIIWSSGALDHMQCHMQIISDKKKITWQPYCYCYMKTKHTRVLHTLTFCTFVH